MTRETDETRALREKMTEGAHDAWQTAPDTFWVRHEGEIRMGTPLDVSFNRLPMTLQPRGTAEGYA